MQKRTKILTTLLVAVILTTVGASYVERHVLYQTAGGWVMWNSKEAYLFNRVGNNGLRHSYLSFPWEAIKENLSGADDPQENRTALLVVRITATATERHVLPIAKRKNGRWFGSSPQQVESVTPIDGKIYAQYLTPVSGPGLARWDGDHFEPVKLEKPSPYPQWELFPGGSFLTENNFNNDIYGWSRREIGELELGDRLVQPVTINVGGEFQLVLSRVVEPGVEVNAKLNNIFSISLLRPGKMPETIVDMEGTSGWVSKADYDWAFHGEIGKRRPK